VLRTETVILIWVIHRLTTFRIAIQYEEYLQLQGFPRDSRLGQHVLANGQNRGHVFGFVLLGTKKKTCSRVDSLGNECIQDHKNLAVTLDCRVEGWSSGFPVVVRYGRRSAWCLSRMILFAVDLTKDPSRSTRPE
jgi:hypothetical protein